VNKTKIYFLMSISLAALHCFEIKANPGSVLSLKGPPTIQTHDSQIYPYPQGKEKLFVLLWATWCKECKEKLSKVLPLQKDHPRIHILALNTEKNLKKVSEFIESEKIALPVAFDLERNFRKTLSLVSVPAWAAFSRDKDSQWKLIDKGDAIDKEKIKIALGEEIL